MSIFLVDYGYVMVNRYLSARKRAKRVIPMAQNITLAMQLRANPRWPRNNHTVPVSCVPHYFHNFQIALTLLSPKRFFFFFAQICPFHSLTLLLILLQLQPQFIFSPILSSLFSPFSASIRSACIRRTNIARKLNGFSTKNPPNNPSPPPNSIRGL